MTRNLTFAASQLLEDHLNDLRQRVIREAALNSAGSAGVDETRAAIRRIWIADRLLPHTVFELVSLLTRPRYAMAYLAAILCTALAATIAVARPGLSAAVGAFIGAFVTLIVYLVVGSRRAGAERTRRARLSLADDFLRGMSQLEGRVRSFSQHQLSLRQSLAAIAGAGLWSEGDITAFGTLLRLRNAIVHQETTTPPETDLVAVLLRLAELASRLEPSYS